MLGAIEEKFMPLVILTGASGAGEKPLPKRLSGCTARNNRKNREFMLLVGRKRNRSAALSPSLGYPRLLPAFEL